MSKRMQIVVDKADLRRFQRMARANGLTLSEWVRQTLRDEGREEPTGPIGRKLAVVRAAAGHAFPAPAIDQMLAEIERGYSEERVR